MKIVMLNGQNHKGSTYHIGRMIIDKISGENEVKEFFFPKDLDHFCLGCYTIAIHKNTLTSSAVQSLNSVVTHP